MVLIQVFQVPASIKHLYTDWCRQVCLPSICSPQVTRATIRDGGILYALTSLRCLSQVWQRNCTIYIHQHQFSHMSFAYMDWRVSTDLISLRYLGLEFTQVQGCLPCWWEEVLSLEELQHLSVCFLELTEYASTVPPINHTSKTGVQV